MKIVIVTGTPGTGKTTIAKKLAKKLDFYYIDVNKVISKYKLFEGYDKKRKTKIVDIKKLNKALIKEINFFKKFNENFDFFKNKNIVKKLLEMPYCKGQEALKILSYENIMKKQYKKYIKLKFNKKINGLIIDSHLSHYLPRKYVDLCIITKCDIKELNKRLKKKKFHKNKIKENLQAEIFDVCYNEALEQKHRVIVINTTKSFNIKGIAKQLDENVS